MRDGRTSVVLGFNCIFILSFFKTDILTGVIVIVNHSSSITSVMLFVNPCKLKVISLICYR